MEFHKIIEHPGIVVNSPIVALARLRLARAYDIDRDIVKAKASYDDFLALWKNADPGVPIFQVARSAGNYNRRIEAETCMETEHLQLRGMPELNA